MSPSSDLTDAQYNELVLRVGRVAGTLQEDERLGGEISKLLQDLDWMHREVLARILGVLEAGAPKVLANLLRDPVVQSLLLIYDFIPQPAELPEHSTSEVGFVPVENLEIPVWIPVGRRQDFPALEITAREVNERSLIFLLFKERILAFSNHCVGSILPLQLGRLEGDLLICPWHGCRYQLPAGQEVQGQRSLGRFPVQVSESGQVRVGFNMKDAEFE